MKMKFKYLANKIYNRIINYYNIFTNNLNKKQAVLLIFISFFSLVLRSTLSDKFNSCHDCFYFIDSLIAIFIIYCDNILELFKLEAKILFNIFNLDKALNSKFYGYIKKSLTWFGDNLLSKSIRHYLYELFLNNKPAKLFMSPTIDKDKFTDMLNKSSNTNALMMEDKDKQMQSINSSGKRKAESSLTEQSFTKKLREMSLDELKVKLKNELLLFFDLEKAKDAGDSRPKAVLVRYNNYIPNQFVGPIPGLYYVGDSGAIDIYIAKVSKDIRIKFYVFDPSGQLNRGPTKDANDTNQPIAKNIANLVDNARRLGVQKITFSNNQTVWKYFGISRPGTTNCASIAPSSSLSDELRKLP